MHFYVDSIDGNEKLTSQNMNQNLLKILALEMYVTCAPNAASSFISVGTFRVLIAIWFDLRSGNYNVAIKQL